MFQMPMSSPMMKTMLGLSAAPAHAAPVMPNTAARGNATTPLLNALLLSSLMSEPSWPRGGDVSDRPRPLLQPEKGHDGDRDHVRDQIGKAHRRYGHASVPGFPHGLHHEAGVHAWTLHEIEVVSSGMRGVLPARTSSAA